MSGRRKNSAGWRKEARREKKKDFLRLWSSCSTRGMMKPLPVSSFLRPWTGSGKVVGEILARAINFLTVAWLGRKNIRRSETARSKGRRKRTPSLIHTWTPHWNTLRPTTPISLWDHGDRLAQHRADAALNCNNKKKREAKFLYKRRAAAGKKKTEKKHPPLQPVLLFLLPFGFLRRSYCNPFNVCNW